MPSGQQVSFKPSLAAMFAQYFHHAAVGAEFVIDGNSLRHKATLSSLEDGVQAIGVRLIGAEHTKVRWIHLEDISEKVPKFSWGFRRPLDPARESRAHNS